MYSIGEMAKKLGVAPSTLRYYDKEGLLPFVKRTNGGIRMFSETDYEWLQVIGCLKKTGMSLKDIKDYVYMTMKGDETIEDRLNLLRKQQEIVEKQISELEETLETVKFKCWYYETAAKAGTTDVPANMSDAEIPPEFIHIREKLKK